MKAERGTTWEDEGDRQEVDLGVSREGTKYNVYMKMPPKIKP